MRQFDESNGESIFHLKDVKHGKTNIGRKNYEDKIIWRESRKSILKCVYT